MAAAKCQRPFIARSVSVRSATGPRSWRRLLLVPIAPGVGTEITNDGGDPNSPTNRASDRS
jgi:hypothetical protein